MKIETKKVIPAGVYDATFDGIERTDHPEYGEGLCWSWTISRGPFKDQQIFRTTKPKGTSRNSCGEFLVSLTGLPYDVAGTKDTDDYIGELCSCIVKATEGGSSRVETFVVQRDAEGSK